jgi:hypothetical protein
MYWRSHFQSDLYIKQHEIYVQSIMEQGTEEFFGLHFLYGCHSAYLIFVTSEITEPTTLMTELGK